MKIIHFFDDDKFIDPAIKLFELVYPEQSLYFVFANRNKPFKYVKSKKAEPLFLENKKEAILEIINKQTIQAEAVFFHALNVPKQKLVNQLNHNLVKVWFVWGFDLYSNWKLLKKNIYEEETKKIMNLNDWKQSLKNVFIFNSFSFHFIHKFRENKLPLPKKINNFINNNYFTEFYQAAEKIDVVVPVIPDEYDLIKSMRINPEFAPFTYGCIEDMLEGNLDKNVLSATNFLVGNSANPSNNHVDVFKKISKLNIGERKIIVPLSYGGSKEYIDIVISEGKKYFGNNFRPLIDFMPLEDYNKIISSCGYIMFNHIRQQAVGNIIATAYLGAKLFLNNKSPVYTYYKKAGINIFDINNLNQKLIDEPLSLSFYNTNKELLINLYSEKAVKSKIKTLFEIVALKAESKNKN